MLTDERPADAGASEVGRRWWNRRRPWDRWRASDRQRWWDALVAPLGPLPPTLVVAVILAGLAVRLVILRSSIGALDSDEAIVGLMARQFASGHVSAFYWGQAYGGTIEVALAAAVFKVFGASTIGVKSIPLLLSGVAAVLTWRVGRRVTTAWAAALAGLLVWVWPANYLWWSIKARGFYEATLCLGLGVLLLALRIGEDARWRDWALLGLIVGLGWWQSPQIGYFVVPAGAWLVWKLRARVWRAVIAVPGALLGAAPWLVANVGSNFASLATPPSSVKGTYLDHLSVLIREGLPMTFGLKVLYSSHWIRPVDLTAVAYVVILAAVVAGAVKGWTGGWLIVAMLVAFPFLHALLSLASTVAEGRYTLFLVPAIALALAHRADRRLAAGALLAGCLAITAIGVLSLHGNTSPYFSGRRVPASLTSLEHALEVNGNTVVWTNYWVAYRLTFETGGRVAAAPLTNGRDPALTQQVVNADPPAAHVFLSGTREDVAFRDGLNSQHVEFTSYGVDGQWTVYLPTTPVGPSEIAHASP